MGHKTRTVDNVRVFAAGAANQEIIRLDITVNQILYVDRLNSR